MKAWVVDMGCWTLTDGQYEALWANASDETKRVNDRARFEAEQAAARSEGNE